jgi:hypothetical protein
VYVKRNFRINKILSKSEKKTPIIIFFCVDRTLRKHTSVVAHWLCAHTSMNRRTFINLFPHIAFK